MGNLSLAAGMGIGLQNVPLWADPVPFLPTWEKRRPLTVDNTYGEEPLVALPVLIELNAATFTFADADATGDDIRFTASDGTTLIPFWIEEWESVGQTARLWVKVSVAAGSSLQV